MLDFGLCFAIYSSTSSNVFLVSLITGEFEIKVYASNDRAMKHFCRNVVIAQ